MSKNAILCAFNCSKTSPCTDWANRYFDEPPDVIAIEGGSSTSFKQTGQKFCADPHAYLRKKGADQTGLIAVATFSAGWGFVDTLMRNQYTRELVDSVILLDGLHCAVGTLDPWIQYAKRAAMGGPSMPLLAMLHSNIIPPYVSAKATNKAIYVGGITCCPSPAEAVDAPMLTKATLDEPVSITSAYGSHTWTADPLAEWEGAGNLYRFEYKGNDAPTHIYIAKMVQPRAWELLASRWNKGGGVRECVELSGEGRVDD